MSLLDLARRVVVVAVFVRARRRRLPDRAAIDAWQEARLRTVLAHARTRYPFYRHVVGDTLDAFPVIDKSVVLAHFAELNDRGLRREDCLAIARAAELDRDFTASTRGVAIGLSSGTSGRQSVFLTSRRERSRWAGEMLAKVLPDALTRGGRVALVLRAGGPLYESVGAGRVAFRFLDLAAPTATHVTELADFRPTILAAPPQALVRLARAQVAGELAIRPERVFSVAEVVDPHDRAEVAAAFGVRVDEIYQATEGFLGISCHAGRLHLNEDLVVVEREPVGGDGRRFVPIVTDLFRTTQAVIRMRLDDVLVAGDEPCPCGSPMQVIDQIVGRADDALLLARRDDPAVAEPFYGDFVRGAVLAAPHVRDFRVVQAASGTLRLAVDPPTAWDGAATALAAAIARAGLVAPAVEPAPMTPLAPLEKLRRVRREVSEGS